MRISLSVALAFFTTASLVSFAQPLPPPLPSHRSEPIPGGVLHWAGKGQLSDPAQDIILSVANHQLRAYELNEIGNVPGSPRPPTLFADGQPLIVAEMELPTMEAVMTGGGHTYVRVTEGLGEGVPRNLWIVDVSAAKVSVTRRIVGCIPLSQAVIDGAYVLRCKVNGEKRTVTHSFKDGVFK